MRSILLTLLLAMVALSGCLGDDDAPAGDGDAETATDSDSDGFTDQQETDVGTDPQDASSVPVLPADLVYTGEGIGIGDVSSNAPCTFGDMSCDFIDVPIPAGKWRVTFTLHSHDGMVSGTGVPYGADYELIVLGQASTNPGDQAEVIRGTLTGPSTETAEIQAWHDIDGSYELIVSFEFP